MTTATIARREIHLTFSNGQEIHDGLDQAVSTLIEDAAGQADCGILVTRHEPGNYTVAFDESVPFGQTREEIAG